MALSDITAVVIKAERKLQSRVRIHVSVFVTSQEKKFSLSTESQVITFHGLRCLYLRRAFFPAKPNHRFEIGVAREAACFEIGATPVFH